MTIHFYVAGLPGMKKNKLLNYIHSTFPNVFDVSTENCVHQFCESEMKDFHPNLLPIQLASNLAYYKRDKHIADKKRIKV